MDHESELVEQLREAVERRTTIGIALGIVMERFGIGRDEAFEHLCRLSSHHNRKLYDIALDVSRTRQLPE